MSLIYIQFWIFCIKFGYILTWYIPSYQFFSGPYNFQVNVWQVISNSIIYLESEPNVLMPSRPLNSIPPLVKELKKTLQLIESSTIYGTNNIGRE